VPAHRLRQVIGELEAVLAGIDAGQEVGDAQARLPFHRELNQPGFGRNQRWIVLVGLPVLHPPEPELVHHGGRRNRCPGQTSVSIAHRRISIVADSRTRIDHRLRLNSVRRQPAQVVEGCRKRVPLGRTVVELGKQQFLIGLTLQNRDVPLCVLDGGVALRRRRRASSDELAVGKQARPLQRAH
jgi:hypothetical protein